MEAAAPLNPYLASNIPSADRVSLAVTELQHLDSVFGSLTAIRPNVKVMVAPTGQLRDSVPEWMRNVANQVAAIDEAISAYSLGRSAKAAAAGALDVVPGVSNVIKHLAPRVTVEAMVRAYCQDSVAATTKALNDITKRVSRVQEFCQRVAQEIQQNGALPEDKLVDPENRRLWHLSDAELLRDLTVRLEKQLDVVKEGLLHLQDTYATPDDGPQTKRNIIAAGIGRFNYDVTSSFEATMKSMDALFRQVGPAAAAAAAASPAGLMPSPDMPRVADGAGAGVVDLSPAAVSAGPVGGQYVEIEDERLAYLISTLERMKTQLETIAGITADTGKVSFDGAGFRPTIHPLISGAFKKVADSKIPIVDGLANTLERLTLSLVRRAAGQSVDTTALGLDTIKYDLVKILELTQQTIVEGKITPAQAGLIKAKITTIRDQMPKVQEGLQNLVGLYKSTPEKAKKLEAEAQELMQAVTQALQNVMDARRVESPPPEPREGKRGNPDE